MTVDNAVEALDDYKKSFFDIESGYDYSYETELVIENYILLEKCDCLDEIIPDHPDKEPLLKEQKQKMSDWFKSHDQENLSSWFYCSYAAMISNYLEFQSLFTKMEEGLLVKEYLEKAIELDPKMSFAQVGLALWYYFAPAISGGSVKKALSYCEEAVRNARNDAELFVAKFYQSQCFLEEGKKAEYNTSMKALKEISPTGRKVALLEKLNDAGYTIFDYQDNRTKIQKKLGL
ncbi:MAG: hypothetical protein K5930_03015 [Treponemataceae bacterium]|nr:hypothetical protein [Treponemataceae bacterium]